MTPNKHLCVFIVIDDVEIVNEDQLVRAIETKMATARTNKFFI